MLHRRVRGNPVHCGQIVLESGSNKKEIPFSDLSATLYHHLMKVSTFLRGTLWCLSVSADLVPTFTLSANRLCEREMSRKGIFPLPRCPCTHCGRLDPTTVDQCTGRWKFRFVYCLRRCGDKSQAFLSSSDCGSASITLINADVLYPNNSFFFVTRICSLEWVRMTRFGSLKINADRPFGKIR